MGEAVPEAALSFCPHPLRAATVECRGVGGHQRVTHEAEKPCSPALPTAAARIRTGDSDYGSDGQTVAGRRSSTGGACLQAVALLGPGISRIQQRHAARCPQLLDLVQVLTHIRGFLG